MAVLKLFKDKIKIYKWDDELYSKSKITEIEGIWYCYIDDVLIKESNDINDFDPIFYKEEEDVSLISSLRCGLLANDNNVTVNDLTNIITSDTKLYKYLNKLVDFDIKQTDGDVKIFRKLIVDDEVFNINYSKEGGSGVIIYDNTVKYNEQYYNCEWTFIELILLLYKRKKYGVVNFRKNGLFCDDFLVSDPHKYLLYEAYLDNDVTLYDVMNYVRNNEQLKVFLSEYCWCDIDSYNDELDLDSTDENLDLDCLKIAKFITLDGDDIEYSCMDFLGVGDGNNGEISSFNIDFTPINNLKHIGIMVEPNCDVLEYKNSEVVSTANGSCGYTLLELFDAIYFEISYFGTPEDRDIARENLKTKYEDTGYLSDSEDEDSEDQ